MGSAPSELTREIEVRKQAQAALRDSEALYSSLVENLPVHVLRKDLEGRFIFASQSFCKLMEKTSEEILGKTDFDLFPQELAEKYRNDDRKIMETDEGFEDVEENRHDGSFSYVHVMKTPVHDAAGKLIGTQCIFWDVTEQRRAETALRDSQALYSSLLENLPVFMVRKDLEGRFTFANRRFCDWLGISSEEIVGKNDYDLFPAELAEKYRKDDLHVIETEERFEDIEETRHGDELRYLHVLKAPVHDSQGATIGTQAIFWDVTESRKAEIALEQERYLMRSLMDNLPDNVYFKDAEGKFLRINRAKAQRSNLSDPEEAVGKSDFDFFPEEHARQAHDDELELMQTGQPVVGKEEKLVWPDGRVNWVSTTKVPLRDGDGNVVGTFGISRDITARMQAQEAMREAKEAAEAASRAKSDFLANMSHEIRTPLNAVIGMTELVLDTDLTAIQREYLTTVRDSGESLLSVINDVLDFSKIEAGKLELEPTTFDLRECLGDTMKSIAIRAHRKGLELACDVASDLPEFVLGDVGRLRQIVINLVGNAIKFTEQGEVVLTVLADTTREENLVLHFKVSDTGIGIPENKLGSVFDAFEQADMSTTRRFGGTGLGLAISSRLVELMGGRLWVESVVDQGSTFHFTAEFEEAAHHEPTKKLKPNQLHELKVLVVDDNATNRRILQEILGNWGMRPTAVSSVTEAIDFLREALKANDPYSLVLSDVNMPEQDGFALAEQVRANPELDSTIIMMLTSGGRTGDVERCGELETAAYLMKPIKQSELFDAIVSGMGDITVDDRQVTEKNSADAKEIGVLKVLLAEDSVANQKLAIGLLEKWGHRVQVANNGREAIEAVREGQFDLVLMDVQMPEVDGLEATQAIRQEESGSQRHVPIVAMTAHAMKGDREKCLESGMDGYASKPIRAADLAASIRAITTAQEIDPSDESQGRSMAEVVDWDTAFEFVQGDREILADVAMAFLEEQGTLSKDIVAAIGNGDSKALKLAAHTIKGGLRTFAAEEASSLAATLEQLGADGDLSKADAIWKQLEESVAQVCRELTEFTSSDNSAQSTD